MPLSSPTCLRLPISSVQLENVLVCNELLLATPALLTDLTAPLHIWDHITSSNREILCSHGFRFEEFTDLVATHHQTSEADNQDLSIVLPNLRPTLLNSITVPFKRLFAVTEDPLNYAETSITNDGDSTSCPQSEQSKFADASNFATPVGPAAQKMSDHFDGCISPPALLGDTATPSRWSRHQHTPYRARLQCTMIPADYFITLTIELSSVECSSALSLPQQDPTDLSFSINCADCAFVTVTVNRLTATAVAPSRTPDFCSLDWQDVLCLASEVVLHFDITCKPAEVLVASSSPLTTVTLSLADMSGFECRPGSYTDGTELFEAPCATQFQPFGRYELSTGLARSGKGPQLILRPELFAVPSAVYRSQIPSKDSANAAFKAWATGDAMMSNHFTSTAVQRKVASKKWRLFGSVTISVTNNPLGPFSDLPCGCSVQSITHDQTALDTIKCLVLGYDLKQPAHQGCGSPTLYSATNAPTDDLGWQPRTNRPLMLQGGERPLASRQQSVEDKATGDSEGYGSCQSQAPPDTAVPRPRSTTPPPSVVTSPQQPQPDAIRVVEEDDTTFSFDVKPLEVPISYDLFFTNITSASHHHSAQAVVASIPAQHVEGIAVEARPSSGVIISAPALPPLLSPQNNIDIDKMRIEDLLKSSSSGMAPPIAANSLPPPRVGQEVSECDGAAHEVRPVDGSPRSEVDAATNSTTLSRLKPVRECIRLVELFCKKRTDSPKLHGIGAPVPLALANASHKLAPTLTQISPKPFVVHTMRSVPAAEAIHSLLPPAVGEVKALTLGALPAQVGRGAAQDVSQWLSSLMSSSDADEPPSSAPTAAMPEKDRTRNDDEPVSCSPNVQPVPYVIQAATATLADVGPTEPVVRKLRMSDEKPQCTKVSTPINVPRISVPEINSEVSSYVGLRHRPEAQPSSFGSFWRPSQTTLPNQRRTNAEPAIASRVAMPATMRQRKGTATNAVPAPIFSKSLYEAAFPTSGINNEASEPAMGQQPYNNLHTNAVPATKRYPRQQKINSEKTWATSLAHQPCSARRNPFLLLVAPPIPLDSQTEVGEHPITADDVSAADDQLEVANPDDDAVYERTAEPDVINHMRHTSIHNRLNQFQLPPRGEVSRPLAATERYFGSAAAKAKVPSPTGKLRLSIQSPEARLPPPRARSNTAAPEHNGKASSPVISSVPTPPSIRHSPSGPSTAPKRLRPSGGEDALQTDMKGLMKKEVGGERMQESNKKHRSERKEITTQDTLIANLTNQITKNVAKDLLSVFLQREEEKIALARLVRAEKAVQQLAVVQVKQMAGRCPSLDIGQRDGVAGLATMNQSKTTNAACRLAAATSTRQWPASPSRPATTLEPPVNIHCASCSAPQYPKADSPMGHPAHPPHPFHQEAQRPAPTAHGYSYPQSHPFLQHQPYAMPSLPPPQQYPVHPYAAAPYTSYMPPQPHAWAPQPYPMYPPPPQYQYPPPQLHYQPPVQFWGQPHASATHEFSRPVGCY